MNNDLETKQDIIIQEQESTPSFGPSTLATTDTYYRSQAFHTTTSVNPLIAAASPLITLATRLYQSHEVSDLLLLKSNLIHEIKAFESQCKSANYRTETIIVARYILCGMIDEAISETSWGEDKKWLDYSLLSHFHNEHFSMNRLTQIIERMKNDPQSHIDLLELYYMCLNLGLEKNKDDELLEKLYQTIRRCQDKRSRLLANPPPNTSTQQDLKIKNHRKMAFITISVSVILISFMYFGFKELTQIASQPLQNAIDQLS